MSHTLNLCFLEVEDDYHTENWTLIPTARKCVAVGLRLRDKEVDSSWSYMNVQSTSPPKSKRKEKEQVFYRLVEKSSLNVTLAGDTSCPGDLERMESSTVDQ